jgi:2-phospho-L-lactate guanylyltransferase
MAFEAKPVADPVWAIGWTALVPVKDLAIAKSRLPFASSLRSSLALAMAQDVVSTLLATPEVRRVLVITDDSVATAAFAAISPEPGGATVLVIPDEPRSGLSDALEYGASIAAERWPGDGVFSFASDVPAVTAEALSAVLGAMSRGTPDRIVVADVNGTGTVLLAARPGVALAPQFEGESRAAHVAGGAVDVSDHASPGLRQDVDTEDDLEKVLLLRIGRATRRVLRTYGLAP